MSSQRKVEVTAKPFSLKSTDWFQKKIKGLNVNANRTSKQIINSKQSVNTFNIGNLYCFFYDPKTADQLPYYDSFPLILVLQKTHTGFIGLNLHYLPIELRVTFLRALAPFASTDKDRNIKKLRISYDILMNSKVNRFVKPCIKQYLFSQVNSNIVKIEANEFETAIWLPLQQFKKAKAPTVWNDTVRKMKNPDLDIPKKREE